MFRKPREVTHEQPSVGRPPTPPVIPSKTPCTLDVPPSVSPPRMAMKTRARKDVPLPTIGRQGLVGSAKKPAGAMKVKPSGKPNGSILSFFKKADSDVGADVSLFVEDKQALESGEPSLEEVDVSADGLDGFEDESRFQECGSAVKRRKLAHGDGETGPPSGESLELRSGVSTNGTPTPTALTKGPFVEDTDSEHEDDEPDLSAAGDKEQEIRCEQVDAAEQLSNAQTPVPEQALPIEHTPGEARPPTLIKQETSYGGFEGLENFEGLDDFDEDLFEGGDEFLERRYMEEQAKLEELDNEEDYDPLPPEEEPMTMVVKQEANSLDTATHGPECPICSTSLAGVSEQDAGVHVNNCLDGNPTPLPTVKKSPDAGSTIKTEGARGSASQYKRPVRAAKPGQASPFTFGQPTMNGGSAFNKLMSNHAEDAAWAEAAAAEHASRGKPAYQRTCPFYKILPGLFICVDAFRYGAVQGCKAYFLSHFHSDHYIGLTSTWSHGPIYCSRVTGNLVRQQLRVDPKYVIDLEFDEQVEVPGTKGVKVTMINANHCPGSSLYLFEKVIGKKTNGDPRLQRILHCGDFRACRAHVEHPLLMPDVQDKVTGKTSEQKLDVCYLDTTYLNPKYAFPNQESVIKACADMCVSLSKHSVDESDGWEQMKRQRAGEGMVKFVRKESTNDVTEEPTEDASADNMKLEKNPHASQQIISTKDTPSATDGRGRLLVVVGTYSIGKERICVGIARALNSKIYAPPQKQRIVAALEDPELNALMTTDPRAAQIHMTPLFEIRAETLDDYLRDYFPHFTRAVGFRPSGWNYRPPNSRFLESPSVSTVLNGDNWKSSYSMKDLLPQRGSTSRASCFGVPYSEHSSFRELTMFCCALRIEKIIPTVNVGSAKGREKMKAWCERWTNERKKNGPWKLPEDGSW